MCETTGIDQDNLGARRISKRIAARAGGLGLIPEHLRKLPWLDERERRSVHSGRDSRRGGGSEQPHGPGGASSRVRARISCARTQAGRHPRWANAPTVINPDIVGVKLERHRAWRWRLSDESRCCRDSVALARRPSNRSRRIASPPRFPPQ